MTRRHFDPMNQLIDLLALEGDWRLLVVASKKRLAELDELRARIAHRYPDAVRLDTVEREILIRNRRGSTRVRTVFWPVGPLDSRWRPDVVVVDQTLPFAVVSASRSTARSRCVPW